jgi:hypothetical protein
MTASQPSHRYIDHRARAELLGSVGAGVLGAGLALLFRETLAAVAVPLLVVGGAMHVLGMYQKHHLDAAMAAAAPRWTTWAYLGLLAALVRVGWIRVVVTGR